MNPYEKNIELIDDYLLDRLAPASKAAFETALEGDPVLKEEFLFQQSVTAAIKQSRQLELKKRLQRIDPSAGISGSMQLLAGIGTAALVLLAAWMFWPKPENISNQDFTAQHDTGIVQVEKENLPKDDLQSATPVLSEKSTEVEFSESKPEQGKRTMTKPAPAATVKNPRESAPSVPAIPEAESRTGFETDGDLKMPTGEVTSQESKKKESAVQIVTKESDKFGYKYYEDKLFLYGNFTESYELIEIIKKGRKKLYLYYAGDFYEIEAGKSEITELEKIDDFKLIKELNNAAEIKELN